MSYILDALRKAEAQRERGAAPGLHSNLAGPESARRPSEWRTTSRRAWVFGLCAVMGLMGAVLWWVTTRAPAPEGRGSVAPVDSVAAAPSAPVLPVATPAVPAPVANTAVVTAPAPQAMQVPGNLPPARNTASAAAAAVGVAVAPATSSALANKRRPAATVSSPPAPAVRAAAAQPTQQKQPAPAVEARIYRLQDLPDEVRRELPALAIGGSVYSSDPASRILIVNGQLHHERDTLAPGVSLEQIKLKAAVLAFKGYRYTLEF